MQVSKRRLVFYFILFVNAFLFLSCNKNDDGSDDDLLGNWIHSTDFDGNGRSEAVVFTINDRVYLGTGSSDSDRFKSFWEYDVDKKYWVQKADFPGNARTSAVAFAVNGKGYVGTGFDGT